jgi:hypothetical protein
MTIPADADRHGRDRAILAAAVAAVLLTSALIVFTVLKAERDGTQALERLQTSQVQQLARSMNTRVETQFKGAAGILNSLKLTGKVADPGDKAQVDRLGSFFVDARTGFYVVDASGLLRRRSAHRSTGPAWPPCSRAGSRPSSTWRAASRPPCPRSPTRSHS